MKEELLIRAASESDIPGIARLEQACFSDAWSPELLRETLGSPYDRCFVAVIPGGGEPGAGDTQAEDIPAEGTLTEETQAEGTQAEGTLTKESPAEETLAGWCNIRVLLDEAELMRICVLPELRRNGAGRALLEAGMEEMRRRGATAATLEVRAGNTAAVRLYEAHGFVLEGCRKKYYRDPVEDAAIYWNRAL